MLSQADLDAMLNTEVTLPALLILLLNLKET